MQRITEPELMGDEAQALAYAQADFSEPNELFLSLFEETFPGWAGAGSILDLGCGPADISYRFAARWPDCNVIAVDGSAAMLDRANAARDQWPKACARVSLVEAIIPALDLKPASHAAVISNSLLHHLHTPTVLWDTIRRFAAPGAAILVMDLRRPRDEQKAAALVDEYARDEPEVLRQDFYNSLLAAFETGEVEAQLAAAGLGSLDVHTVSDRHLCVSGHMPVAGS